MNRRGFLSAILKAGVSAAILPPAATYARRWVKSKDSVFMIPIIYKRPIVNPYYLIPTHQFLPSFQDFDAWVKLHNEIKWKPNMGDTMR